MPQIARSAVLIGFDSLCRSRGLNPLELLRRCGLDPLLLRRSDLHLPYARFAELLSLAVQDGGGSDFGLRLSEYHDYLILGPFGLLLAQAESFSEVLKLTQSYVHLHAQGIALSEQARGDSTLLEYRLMLDEPVDARQLLELGLAVVHRSMRSLFGAQWQPQALWLSHACLSEPALYEQFFACPVLFEQRQCGFVVDLQLNEAKPLSQRPQLKSHLLAQYAEAPQPGDWVERVQSLLAAILPTGEARLEVAARLLNCHPRSLQQSLQAQGLSFRQLLDRVRYAEACQQLKYSDRSITDLALHLGYADETAFSRAFKRWSGLPPWQWRQQS